MEKSIITLLNKLPQMSDSQQHVHIVIELLKIEHGSYKPLLCKAVLS